MDTLSKLVRPGLFAIGLVAALLSTNTSVYAIEPCSLVGNVVTSPGHPDLPGDFRTS